MSSTYAEPLDRLDAVLDELAGIGPEFRTLAERQEFLLRVARVKAWLVHHHANGATSFHRRT
jgi:hypothetical protein